MQTVIKIDSENDIWQETQLNGKILGSRIIDEEIAKKLIADGAIDRR